MADTLTPLILDFLEWTAAGPRSYAETMEIWRTSCPRLTIWEDAIDQGLVVIGQTPGRQLRVDVTCQGRRLLANNGRKVSKAFFL